MRSTPVPSVMPSGSVFPTSRGRAFTCRYCRCSCPVVLVLVVENIGHVKSLTAMTGINYDRSVGRALFADGVSTMLAKRRRWFGHHYLCREHRGHGGHQGVLDRRLLGGRYRRNPARLSPKIGATIAAIRRCTRRRYHRAVRPRRHPRYSHLGEQQGRFLQADQPVHRRHRPHHRHQPTTRGRSATSSSAASPSAPSPRSRSTTR